MLQGLVCRGSRCIMCARFTTRRDRSTHGTVRAIEAPGRRRSRKGGPQSSLWERLCETIVTNGTYDVRIWVGHWLFGVRMRAGVRVLPVQICPVFLV